MWGSKPPRRRRPIHQTETEWRDLQVVVLASIRLQITELSFLVCLIAAGVVSASWWPTAPAVAVATAFVVALQSYWRATRSWRYLDQAMGETDYEASEVE